MAQNSDRSEVHVPSNNSIILKYEDIKTEDVTDEDQRCLFNPDDIIKGECRSNFMYSGHDKIKLNESVTGLKLEKFENSCTFAGNVEFEFVEISVPKKEEVEYEQIVTSDFSEKNENNSKYNLYNYRDPLDNHVDTEAETKHVCKKLFACKKCSYKRCVLQQHMLRHDQNDEIKGSTGNHLLHSRHRRLRFSGVQKKFYKWKTLVKRSKNFLRQRKGKQLDKFNLHNDHKNRELTTNKQFKCELCPFSTNWASVLWRHKQGKHAENRQFKCDLCDFSTSWKKNLQKHKQGKHAKTKEIKCELCDFSTNWQESLWKHKKQKHTENKQFKCDLCDFSTSWKGGIQKHKTEKHPENKLFKCDLCDFSTNWQESLWKHKKRKHVENKQFKCDQCVFSTSSEASIQKHKQGIHGKNNEFKCDLCDFSTNWQENLRAHRNGKHSENKQFKCDQCDFSTSWQASIQKHKQGKHGKNKNFKCHLCDFSSSWQTNLYKHKRAKHAGNKQFKSDTCDFFSN